MPNFREVREAQDRDESSGLAVVVYGAFDSPLSYLASTRVDCLLERGVEIQWRAVRSRREIPPRGLQIEGDFAAELEAKVSVVNAVLAPSAALRLPRRLPPTQAAVAAFASVVGARAHTLRRAFFRALWRDGADLGDPRLVERIVGKPAVLDAERATRWQRLWSGIADADVPMALLRTGYVFRRMNALDALACLGADGGPSRRHDWIAFLRRTASGSK